MKALTRTLALLGCAAALGAALAACDQELRDSGDRAATSQNTGIGNNNELTLTGFDERYYNAEKTAIDVKNTFTAYESINQAPVKWTNPFKGRNLNGATIIYDIYNYEAAGALKNLWGFSSNAGKFYMSPSMYLGYNGGVDGFFDANLINYGQGTYSIPINTWVNIAVVLTGKGWSVYKDGTLLYETSTLVSPNFDGDLTDFSKVLGYLSGADFFVIGAGNWWDDQGAASSYIKGIKLISSALTAQQVEEVYDETLGSGSNNGGGDAEGGDTPPSVTPPPTVAPTERFGVFLDLDSTNDAESYNMTVDSIVKDGTSVGSNINITTDVYITDYDTAANHSDAGIKACAQLMGYGTIEYTISDITVTGAIPYKWGIYNFGFTDRQTGKKYAVRCDNWNNDLEPLTYTGTWPTDTTFKGEDGVNCLTKAPYDCDKLVLQLTISEANATLTVSTVNGTEKAELSEAVWAF